VVSTLEEIRGIIRNSFEVTGYVPSPKPGWEEAYQKFEKLG
jgi:hypothetical protein